jgi:hypothetical protein
LKKYFGWGSIVVYITYIVSRIWIGAAVMTAPAQLKATAAYRKRTVERGLVRVDALVPKNDRALILELADRLRGDRAFAVALRRAIDTLSGVTAKSGLDMFSGGLAPEDFDGVFDRPRERQSREIEL